MPEPIEARLPAPAVLADALARHAAALHVVFMRGFADILAKRDRSLRDASRTLKAQNLCRMAFGLLLKLQALEQAQKNSRNRTKTIEGGNSPSRPSTCKTASGNPLVPGASQNTRPCRVSRDLGTLHAPRRSSHEWGWQMRDLSAMRYSPFAKHTRRTE